MSERRPVFNQTRRRLLVGSGAALMSAYAAPTAWAVGNYPNEICTGLYLGDRFDGMVSLTFDDGPVVGVTDRILDVLARKQAKATFFVCGRRLAKHSSLLRRIVSEGHELGNHTWSHPSLATLTLEKIGEQFDRTQKAVDDALGHAYPMTYFRPPFGSPWFSKSPRRFAAQDRISEAVKARNGVIVLWQLATGDTRPDATSSSVLKMARRTLRRRHGGIYCMHDTKRHTREALPRLIEMIRNNGCCIAPLDEFVSAKYGSLGLVAARP